MIRTFTITVLFLLSCVILSIAIDNCVTDPNCPPLEAECPSDSTGYITTNFGTLAPNDQNSLKAGARGPTLMEDFHFREKMTHFDHERIPERVVHARGAGAHGVFTLYESQDDITKAEFLTGAAGKETPVFVRFSTVLGFRGSIDTPRDVRGFATRFYTKEGNFDLVGNNIPVFFIQDAIRFPDLIHAGKPEPHHEIPQAATAHDNFWDFISLTPESTHMIMWAMSDRTLPRYFSTMEGFGVHTFRLVNAQNVSHLVKFHWKPLAGVHSLVWDESQKLGGKDPDFQRRNLWESIEMGVYPEWEFGIQIVNETDQLRFGFDLLDATKIIPEELIPVRKIGKLQLNRNIDNFFEETEQIAYHPAHIVPGIDFTDDPLLQGRLFSYIDTQLSRFRSPNYLQLPINRPIVPVRNNNQDGPMRYQNMKGRVNYEPNSFNVGGCPFSASVAQGAFHTWPQQVDGMKVREKSPTFYDFYSQATLFYNSLVKWEKNHLTNALRFELSKVETVAIRERMVANLNQVDFELAKAVAIEIGVTPPSSPGNHCPTNSSDEQNATSVSNDMGSMAPASSSRQQCNNQIRSSEALSQANTTYIPKGLKVGIIIVDEFSYNEVTTVQTSLNASGIATEIISTRLGDIASASGEKIPAIKTLLNSESLFYDAIFVANVNKFKRADMLGRIRFFVVEAFKHCKPIGLMGKAINLLKDDRINISISTNDEVVVDYGVVTVNTDSNLDTFKNDFLAAVIKQRFFEREDLSFYDDIAV